MVSLVLLVPRAEQRMHNCNKEDLLISLVQQYLKQILQGVPWAVFKDVFARSQACPKHGAYVLLLGTATSRQALAGPRCVLTLAPYQGLAWDRAKVSDYYPLVQKVSGPGRAMRWWRLYFYTRRSFPARLDLD